VIRQQAGMPVSRFCQLTGIPRRTYHRWQANARRTGRAKGPWPAPVVDPAEALVAKYAADWPAWGHRKIYGLMRAIACRCPVWNGRCAAAACYNPSTTKLSAASWPRPARPRSPNRPPHRTRCGSSTSPSTRPPLAGPGAWPGSATATPSTSTAGTWHHLHRCRRHRRGQARHRRGRGPRRRRAAARPATPRPGHRTAEKDQAGH
jgi:hypothetical protein